MSPNTEAKKSLPTLWNVPDPLWELIQKVLAVYDPPAKTGRKATPARTPTPTGATATTRRIEEMLRRKLQTGVSLHLSGASRGEVRIDFFSNDDLTRLLNLLGISIED